MKPCATFDLSANVMTPSQSSGRSAPTKAAAASTTLSALFFMLPLWSSVSTIVTGVVASWNVSIFCSTPSSRTMRSSFVTSRKRLCRSIAVNSSAGRTGGGCGAK